MLLTKIHPQTQCAAMLGLIMGSHFALNRILIHFAFLSNGLAVCALYWKTNFREKITLPLIRKFNRSSSQFASRLKSQPSVLYELILSAQLNNLRLLGKLTERQGRKVTGLREAMAAGLRHGC